MKNKILSILFCFIIVLSTLTVFVAAEESSTVQIPPSPDLDIDSIIKPNSNFSVLPNVDGESLYSIFVDPNNEVVISEGYTNYPIRGFTNSITSIPDEDSRRTWGVFSHFIENYYMGSLTSTKVVTLFDGSQFHLQSYGSSYQYRQLKYVQFDKSGGGITITNVGPEFNETQDIMIYMSSSATLDYYIYNVQTGIIDSYGTINNVTFYGSLFYNNSVPGGSDTAYEEGYFDGYEQGRDDGYSIGYRDGYESVNPDTLYNEAYEAGYNAGLEVQYSDTDLYALGFAKGQEVNTYVPNAIKGFFEGMQGFFAPFLSIGIGNLTLYTLLGFMLFGFVLMAIVKIIRG